MNKHWSCKNNISKLMEVCFMAPYPWLTFAWCISTSVQKMKRSEQARPGILA